jgi:hypothetical protein
MGRPRDIKIKDRMVKKKKKREKNPFWTLQIC